MKMFKFLLVTHPIKTFLLLAIAFALLLVGILVPLVFKERVVVHNKWYPLMDGATTLDATTQNFLWKWPSIQLTWKYGIFFYCKTFEFIQDGYSTEDFSLASPSLSGKLGTFCNFLPFGLNVDSDMNYEDMYYDTAVVNNSITILGETDASTIPGIPIGNPWGGIPGGHVNIYSGSGKSAFFYFVNPHIFDALRVFLIIAVIITAIALIIALILAILHCSSCKVTLVHSKSGTAHLQKFLHFLLFFLLFLWFIIIILLIVVYNQVIHGLFDNPKWTNLFVIAIAFWLLWVAYILTLVAFLITKKIKIKHPHHPHCPHHPHHPHPPHHCDAVAMHEMTSVETPVSYADYKYGPSMTAASPSAPPAHSHGVVASSFV